MVRRACQKRILRQVRPASVVRRSPPSSQSWYEVQSCGCGSRHAPAAGCIAAVLKTPDEEVDDYLQVLAEMAEASGGGISDPPQTVGDCPDWEDNRILDLAAAVGAFLIDSADADLTSMSPWRGRPIIEPQQFASMVDASRRARRRRR